MSTDASTPENDANLSGLGRALLGTNEGSKPAAGPWVPPTAEELQKELLQYEITRMLGRGGMGAVYMGRQKSLDRPVAIKILSNQLEEADASFAERFKNEARAMAKLSHPGIVGVFDSGETANGLLYIVMEFIEGTDVAKMIAKSGRLHTEHAMAITAHVCDALAYAHERGIIHRDIKPANIMVGYDGVVKVADFGLAKMTQSQNTGLTQSGMAMGTLHYMAPEALMLGSAVDHRADIYAVGVMLYQMLTGKLPQGLFELPSLQVPGLDPRYDGIIGKALREDRDLRYPSVVAMRQDLDAILTQPVVKVEASADKAPAALQTQARPQRPGGQPHRAALPQVIVRTDKKGSPLLWVALMAMSGIAGWLYWQSLDRSPVTSGDVPSSPQMTGQSGVASDTPELPEKSVPTPTTQVNQAPPAPSVTVRHQHKVTSNQFELRWNNDAISEETVKSILANWDIGAVGMQELMGVAPERRGPVFVVVEASPESLPRVGFTSYLPKVGNDIGLSAARLEDVVALHQEQNIVWSTLFHVITNAYTAKADAKWVRIGRTPTGEAIMYGIHTVVRQAAWKTEMLERVASSMGNGGPLQTLAAERATIDAHLAAYEADSDSSWASEMNKGTGTSHSPGSVHLLAGILFRLAAEHGGAPFLQRLLAKEIPDMPEVVSEPQALEELAKACGRAAGRDLKTAFIRRWRWPLAESSTPALSTGPTTWTDTKGRRITATFKAIASGNVLLDIAGKVTPVPMNTLSAESQKLARTYHDQSNPATTDDPAQATKDRPFVNSLGMKFVPVPGTKVLMCIHETRIRDYTVFAQQHPGVDMGWKVDRANRVQIIQDADHPVVLVSWSSAKAFCDWLSAKERQRYRLPTDREWSMAVGIGDGENTGQPSSDYPWGIQWPPPPGFGNYADSSATYRKPSENIAGYRDGFPYTAPVMSFPPNQHGIFDLGGNVCEACDDGGNDGQSSHNWRGGSYGEVEPYKMQSSFRLARPHNYTSNHSGFRVVLELP